VGGWGVGGGLLGLRVGSKRLLQVLDLYWRSPKFGDLLYKLKKTICSPYES